MDRLSQGNPFLIQRTRVSDILVKGMSSCVFLYQLKEKGLFLKLSSQAQRSETEEMLAWSSWLFLCTFLLPCHLRPNLGRK